MYVSFNELDKSSRIWIYQSDRTFTEEEETSMRTEIERFLTDWTSHNRSLQASFQIVENRILVMAVDEGVADASGCSIDKMMHFIQSLEKKLNLTLLNRQLITYQQEESWQTTNLRDFIQQVRNGTLPSDTPIYDTLIDNKGSWEEASTKPVEKSWMSRMI